MNIAARIAAQASANQVFVGEDLVRDVEPRGYRVQEVGEFELKGIARPVTLFEAVRDGSGRAAEACRSGNPRLRLISRLFRIQPGEGRRRVPGRRADVRRPAAFTIGESGVDALFFDRVGAQALPTMYLLQGGTTFIAMLALTATLGRARPRRAYIGGADRHGRPCSSANGRSSRSTPDWVYRLLWVTVAVAYLVQGIYLWGTAGAVVDTRQAKRLFPIFGAGGILGAVVAGLLTRPLASAIGHGEPDARVGRRARRRVRAVPPGAGDCSARAQTTGAEPRVAAAGTSPRGSRTSGVRAC